MRLPKHQNPTQGNRISKAPYNFIPLPEKVVKAVDSPTELPDHDCYHQGRYSGYFEVLLTTRSPLYIRCPMTREQFDYEEQGKYADGSDKPKSGNPEFRKLVKNLAEFFYTAKVNEPVIPGSSLRGMLRSLLEIITFSKVQWVSDKKLFFRTVDDTAVGRYYRSRMTNKVETGFLKRQGEAYVIKVCRMARIRWADKRARLYDGPNQPSWTPKWESRPHQHQPIFVKLSSNGKLVQKHSFDRSEDSTWQEGIFVITGNVPSKTKEFVFLLPDTNSEMIDVPHEMIELFHDDEQITQWQQRAFPKDRPSTNCRERDGGLCKNPREPGEPVFFLRENGSLTFLGRAGMFRLPYERCAKDLVHPELRDESTVDFAEALFGFTEQKSKEAEQGEKVHSYSGRIFVTDAKRSGDGDPYLGTITPNILATPKPTAFQHYLTQQTPDKKLCLDHYGSPTNEGCDHETVIRGTKVYWHKGDRTDDELKATPGSPNVDAHGNVDEHSTQHTQFNPIKSGQQFKFRVYFENLSEVELGALCWTLSPQGEDGKEYIHKLGMGKPFGMGAVELKPTLNLTDRSRRYQTLFKDDQWEQGLCGEVDCEKFIEKFEGCLIHHAGLNVVRLREDKRIEMLLKMMEWPGPKPDETAYIGLDEFRQRKVLPDPLAVASAPQSVSLTSSHSNEGTIVHRQNQPQSSSFTVEDVLHIASSSRQTKRIKKTERVRVLSKPTANRARVLILSNNKEVECSNLREYYKITRDSEVEVSVVYAGDEPVSAEYKPQ